MDGLLESAAHIERWVISFGGGITHEDFLQRVRRHRPAELAPIRIRYRTGTAIRGDSGAETEKNIDRLLAIPEEQNVILFFDEADALFGRRTPVNDAHDRYANQEVSYLRQRLASQQDLVFVGLERAPADVVAFSTVVEDRDPDAALAKLCR